MAVWHEEQLEQACREFPEAVRRLKGRNRREAQNRITQLVAEIRMLADQVIEAQVGVAHPTPQPGEAADAFRAASRIVTQPIRRSPSGTHVIDMGGKK